MNHAATALNRVCNLSEEARRVIVALTVHGAGSSAVTLPFNGQQKHTTEEDSTRYSSAAHTVSY